MPVTRAAGIGVQYLRNQVQGRGSRGYTARLVSCYLGGGSRADTARYLGGGWRGDAAPLLPLCLGGGSRGDTSLYLGGGWIWGYYPM